MGDLLDKIAGGRKDGGEPPKWFNRDNLLILVLLGVLLFVIALPVKKEEKEESGFQTTITGTENETTTGSSKQEAGGAVSVSAQASGWGDTQEYAVYLENKLKKMLESAQGLEEVEVMITLESSEEKVVEKDMTAERSNTEEQDSAGGVRSVNTSHTEYQTIYAEDTQGEPFVVKTICPKVEGVLVVAKGTQKGNMTGEIAQIVQALFGVEAHRIKVLEK